MGTLVWKRRERLVARRKERLVARRKERLVARRKERFVARRKERLAVMNEAREQERAVVPIPNWNERSLVAAKKRERPVVVRKIQRAVGTVRTRS
jgi:hypothetical protein